MYYIGVEIGGTKQQVCLGESGGRLLARRQVKLGQDTTAENIRAWIQENIDQLRGEYPIQAIGVGFGGPIDPEREKIVCSCQIPGWEDFPLGDWFREAFGLPAVVRNDTVAAGLGELYQGAGQGSSRFFYTNIGTGIGGGFYWLGGYCASTLGYVWVPDWENPEAGQATRVEYLCAGPSIERRLNTPGYVPEESILWEKSRPLTCGQLGQCAQLGDEFCLQELDRVARSFSLGLANAMTLLSLDRIVVGGGVAKIGEALFSRLRRFTREGAYVADVERIDIRPGALGDDAVLAGALLLAEKPNIHVQ